MQKKIQFNFALRWEQNQVKIQEQKKKFTKSMALGVAGLSFVVLLGSTPWAWEYKLKLDLEKVNGQIQELQSIDAEVQKINSLKAQIAKQKQIQEMIRSTRDPANVLDQLKNILPVGSQVNSLALSADNSMVIRVTIAGPIDVARLWMNLRDSKLFEPVDIQTVSLQDQKQTLNLSLKLK